MPKMIPGNWKKSLIGGMQHEKEMSKKAATKKARDLKRKGFNKQDAMAKMMIECCLEWCDSVIIEAVKKVYAK